MTSEASIAAERFEALMSGEASPTQMESTAALIELVDSLDWNPIETPTAVIHKEDVMLIANLLVSFGLCQNSPFASQLIFNWYVGILKDHVQVIMESWSFDTVPVLRTAHHYVPHRYHIGELAEDLPHDGLAAPASNRIKGAPVYGLCDYSGCIIILDVTDKMGAMVPKEYILFQAGYYGPSFTATLQRIISLDRRAALATINQLNENELVYTAQWKLFHKHAVNKVNALELQEKQSKQPLADNAIPSGLLSPELAESIVKSAHEGFKPMGDTAE